MAEEFKASFYFGETETKYYLTYPDGTGQWSLWDKKRTGSEAALDAADRMVGEYIRKLAPGSVKYIIVEGTDI